MGSMKRCCGVNHKHPSAKRGIWNFAFKQHRKMWNLKCLRQPPNSTLRRRGVSTKNMTKLHYNWQRHYFVFIWFMINTTTSFHGSHLLCEWCMNGVLSRILKSANKKILKIGENFAQTSQILTRFHRFWVLIWGWRVVLSW